MSVILKQQQAMRNEERTRFRNDLLESANTNGVARGAGTLTASTVNDATITDHTHAITETHDGDTTPLTLLYTDASGTLRIRRLGVGAAATATDGTITVPAVGWIGNDMRVQFSNRDKVLDQYALTENVDTSVLVGQSFVAGITGYLVELDLYANKPAASISIREGENINGTLLATATTYVAPTNYYFSSPPYLKEGETYTIRVESGAGTYCKYYSTGSVYPAGKFYIYGSFYSAFSMWFRTYMEIHAIEFLDDSDTIVGNYDGTNWNFYAEVLIAQASATGAKPVIEMSQSDQDYVLCKFIGYADAASADRTFVAASDFTTPGSLVGWIQVEIRDDGNRITDGDYYVPIYAAPTA